MFRDILLPSSGNRVQVNTKDLTGTAIVKKSETGKHCWAAEHTLPEIK